MRKLNGGWTVCAAALVAAAIISGAAPRAPGAEPETENVVLVVIDGLRCFEAFHSAPGSDLVKFMRDELAPRGTLYRNLWNQGVTQTQGAHLTMAVGAWQLMPNSVTYFSQNEQISTQADLPLLFEYYNKTYGLGPDDNQTFYVGGKCWKGDLAFSVDPEYGEEYAGKVVVYPPPSDTALGDTATFRRLLEVLDTHHPHLVLCNLKDVDESGHRADPDRPDHIDIYYHYRSTVWADSLVRELWNWLEADPVYSGKTTLIVTTDHGRHDDRHGGLYHHGGICHGCRHLFLLALGPDTPANQVVNRSVDQIDICPTVGELLGFHYPKARGAPLVEMLDFTPTRQHGIDYGNQSGTNRRLTTSDGISVHPQIVCSASGQDTTLHVVYLEKINGGFAVRYLRSTNGGDTWKPPYTLSRSADLDAQVPAICAVGDTVHAVWMGCLTHRAPGCQTVPRWYLRWRRSTNGGASWGVIFSLWGSKYEQYPVRQWPSWSIWDPAISHDGESTIGISVLYGIEREMNRVGCFYSTNGGNTWGMSWLDTLASFPLHADITTETSWSDRWAYGVWYDLIGEQAVGWRIRFNRSSDSGENWFDLQTLRADSSYCADPAIVAQLNNVGVSWAHYVDGIWQAQFKRSSNYGEDWYADAPVSSALYGAIDPELVVGADNCYYDVWAEYDCSSEPANSEIVYRYSSDAGATWSATEYQVSQGESYSVRPSICEYGWVVWEDYRHGNWEIYFDRIGY